MFPAVLSGGSQRYSHCASGYHVLALYGKTKLFRNQLNDWTVLPPNYTRSHVNHDTNRENKDPQFFSGMQRHKKEELLSGQSRMAMFKAMLEAEPSSQCLRVQVLVKGKWRSVCTNSRNWTEADLAVTCRHLGFTGGEWHHWHEHLNDSTVKQILFQDPSRFSLLVTLSIFSHEIFT